MFGSLKGIALNDAAAGEIVDFCRVGVFVLPKVTADEITIGDPVSWNFETGLVGVGGAFSLGIATENAPADSGSVNVLLG